MPDIKQTTHDLERVVMEANPWKESPPVSCSVPYSLLCDVLSLLKEHEVKPLCCKDCSYRRKDDWCDECRRIVKESDYCSFGSWEGR